MKILKSAAFAIIVGFLSLPASAYSIATSVGTYDVLSITGTYNNLLDTLDDQVWWGDITLAAEFAGAVMDNLGLPNIGGDVGPYFVTGDNGSTFSGADWVQSSASVFTGPISSALNSDRVFAIATPVPVPEPGTLSLLAVGLVGSVLMRRKKIA